MPTVVIEGRFRFVINTRENKFEPLTSISGWITRTPAASIWSAGLLLKHLQAAPTGTSWRHTEKTPKLSGKSGRPSTGSNK